MVESRYIGSSGGRRQGVELGGQFAEVGVLFAIAWCGGEVGVESELGRGSTFWFTARVGRGPARAARPQPAPELRGRRILVADDSGAAAFAPTSLAARVQGPLAVRRLNLRSPLPATAWPS